MWKSSMKYKVTLREHHHHRSGSAKPLILTRSSFFCFGWEPDLGKSTSHLGGERLRASHRLSVKVPQRKTSYLTISENDLKLDLRAPFWCQQWRNALRSGSTCSKVLKQKLRSVMRYWISWKKHPKILPALWYTIMVARDMCIFLLKSPKILKITGYVAGLETKTSIPIFFTSFVDSVPFEANLRSTLWNILSRLPAKWVCGDTQKRMATFFSPVFSDQRPISVR